MTADAAAPDSSAGTTSPPGPSSGPPPSLRDFARRAAGHVLFALALGMTAQLLIEVATFRGNGLRLLLDRPGVMLTGAVVLALVAGLLLAVSGRRWLTTSLMLGLAGVTGVAGHLKFAVRREPLYPRDLVFVLEPGFLLEMVRPAVLWGAALGLPLMFVATWAGGRVLERRLRRGAAGPTYRRLTVGAVRAGVALTCLALLASAASFNRPGNPWRGVFEAAGVSWRPANQVANYQTNGFVSGFLFNLDHTAMVRPPGYSRAAMARIVAEYTAAAEERNASATGSLEGVNVITVLSESLSDLTRLEGITLAEDPLRRTRALMEGLPHGLMLAPKIGGGTSVAEFEALTGMSLAQFEPTMDTPYQMLVPDHRTFPSAVQLFDRLGHTGLAIHPYRRTMYQRNLVYPILGFDEFVDREEMTYSQHVGSRGYVSDESAFQETLRAIESEDAPVFVNLVTMQNHTPYTGKYPDPIRVRGVVRASARLLGQYAAGVARTDLAIERFVERLEQSEEKAVVVLYGDHLPGALPEEVFAANSDLTLHETPFFIYSNYQDLPAQQLPTTSPIFFLPKVFALAGAPVPPYYALLGELEKHVAALEHGRMLTPQGLPVAPRHLSPEGRDVLEDYRLVQYDLAVGKRYAASMLEPAPPRTLSASGSRE